MTERPSTPDWHTLDAPQVGEHLKSPPGGLSHEQAQRRLAQHGANALPEPPRRSALRRFLGQFHNVLLYLILAAAGITAFLGHTVDTAVLLAAALVNALIGFFQEGKAEAALEGIRRMLSPHATVVREGHRQEVPAASLVPGDRVVIASGDRVPADLRLVNALQLRVDESALTGESVPVDKSTEPVATDAPLGDREGMAYSGTLVVQGQGEGVVVATGTATELGGINRLLTQVERARTPMLQQIDRFGRLLAAAILGVSALTFLLGTLWRGQPAAEMFMMVVALAAAAIPESLPAILTVTLALGVQRMARHRAILRHLPAVETLGSVTVICSDKTGTLTRNEMTVQRVAWAGGAARVEGVGYEPQGTFCIGDHAVDPGAHPALRLCVEVGVLCNDARMRAGDGGRRVEGDPTDGALLVLGEKANWSREQGKQDWPREKVIPFESERRFMATQHRAAGGEARICVKGAPERVLDLCRAQWTDAGEAPLDVDGWRRIATDMASQGLRVLALALRSGELPGGRFDGDALEGELLMLGLVGLIDPPRAEARAAVAECRSAGMQVKMITGDHAETARAIGAQLGIGSGKPALTGAELSLMDDAELRRVVQDVDVFARTSPEHKLRLVRALQAGGEVVAMTGDGVNDAPALKQADIGTAMGHKGTEAAKEAAAMVLADDNFATIVLAVREGRAVYDNIRKFILFILPTNGGEALIVISAILFELTLPLTAAQVLWINMVTSAALGLALAFEPPEPGIMARRPRPPGESLLTGLFAWRVVMVSVLMMVAALGLFLWELERGTGVETARTMAVNTIVAAEMFYLLNSRYVLAPVLTREGLTGNPYVLLSIAACVPLQLLFTYTPQMNEWFGTAPLSVGEWLRVVGAGLFVFLAAEGEKALVRRLRGPLAARLRERAA
ncbi:cation-transporting P-type ATPase [Ramlibacter rhizophilus]|uniref:Cation-transporting P-type ATPase n=1 Tax=Ramlibacter rhizophilus TaxID=1781167 RepID=A0A4Z0BJ38_9BURK|nr:cation-transporting P-type ATPase [Ramlibacter rhizophilus]TFY98790.1 cation-transporting P-type ATPase [Ramlibacter rhizophilus]